MKYTRINGYRYISVTNADIHNKNLLIVFSFIAVLVYIFYALNLPQGQTLGKFLIRSAANTSKKYLINTPKCKIPDLDPFNEEVLKFFLKKEYVPCSSLDLLSYVERIDNVPFLRINESLIPLYSWSKVSCCYSNISRVRGSDDEVVYSQCLPFKDSVRIHRKFIRVVCKNLLKTVYSNVHAVTFHKTQRQDIHSSNEKYSVLFVGIDSMSKQNLMRTMPETRDYLEKNYISLRGYNKIADNTFPNLMGILSGQNQQQLESTCPDSDFCDDCPIMWKDFQKSGYVTAYAEDESTISTFNYRRPGFMDPPTDYYYRPYVIAAEQVSTKLISHMNYCSGPESTGERILGAAKDFAIQLEDVLSFGLFWTTTFSHDDINVASSMDRKVLDFLRDERFNAALNETIMVFFSDHGFRFGSIRYTHAGWLEERLPFFYLRLPASFERLHPEKVHNLRINAANRLTTPYDMFVTLGEVLQLADPSYVPSTSQACPKCRSLFTEVPEDRTCSDAGVLQHWCTCADHAYVNPREAIVRSVAEFVVDELNGIVRSYAEGRECRRYDFDYVLSAGLVEGANTTYDDSGSTDYIVLSLATVPGAKFEATVQVSVDGREEYRLLGDISRIDRYGANSKCVNDAVLRKYCYCYQGIYTLKKSFCELVNC